MLGLPEKESQNESMKSPFKLVLKIAAGLFVLLVLTAVVGIGLFIKSLPSRSEVAASLKEPPSEAPASSKPNSEKAIASSASPTSAQQSAEVSNAEVPDEADEEARSQEGFQTIVQILDEDPKDVRVCNQLGSSRFAAREAEEKDLSFDEIFSDKRDDSVAEAFRVPLRSILQDPQVSSLIREIHEISESQPEKAQRESLFEKMGFYSKLAATAAHLYTNKKQFENIGNRALHLSLLAKIAARKPEMAQNPILYDFCRRMENSMIEHENVNIESERQEILKMISFAGMTPEELNFNPDQYIHFNVQSSKDKFSFSFSDTNDSEAQN